MGMWILRSLLLRFKGKLARFAVVVLVVFALLNVFLFKRGTRSETDRPNSFISILNKNVEKPFDGELETRFNGLQGTGVVESRRISREGKISNHSPKIGTEVSDILKINGVTKTKSQDSSKQQQQLNTNPTDANSRETMKPQTTIETLENKESKKFNHEKLSSLEYVNKEEKNVPNPGEREPRKYFCPQLFISRLEDIKYGACEPHKPTRESCFYADQLYYLDKNSAKCKNETEEICRVKVDKTSQELRISDVRVQCDGTLCSEKWYSTALAVWTLDPRSGDIAKVQSFSSTLDLEKELPRIIIESIDKKVYFVVLKCSRRKDGEYISQLIPIDPTLTIQRNKKTKLSRKNTINVNILLLDSVSRAHFYRSLPKTIDLFRSWSSSKSAPANVFDFELFQAIHGHTAENTHALFTGETLPPHLEDEFPPVEMGVAFGRFVKAGYQTLWQEDLCWKGGWGLMTDLAVSSWEDLASKLEENFIDSIGITHSSCEILKSYNLETPFNGPEGNQICYNGKFQHEYLLNYTLATLDAIKSTPEARPLLSYMSLSVGHDNNGRRIQTLDQALVDYVDRLGQHENTLTMILADHGNTYTDYTVTALEGRFEMYHPSLFMIVPRNVAKMLGSEAMRALRTNQRRLVNMYDLHHTLMALAGPLNKGHVSRKGVFTPIPLNRTCNDIKLVTPNLCVCEGWDSPTTNDTLKISIVEFAVGAMNHIIDENFMQGSKGKKDQFPLLKSCRRLVPVQFENVRERIDESGMLRTTMDIHVKSLEQNIGKTETFHVEIQSKETPDSYSMDLKLIHFDRMSVFEKYKKCSDAGVSPLLCTCSNTPEAHRVDNSKRKIDISVIKSSLRDSFQAEVAFKFLDKRECLLLIRRQHSKQSFSLEFANLCLGYDFFVLVQIDDLENMKLSRNTPFELRIPAGSMRLGLTMRKDLEYWSSTFKIKAKITKITNRTMDSSKPTTN